jgi:hypothetical protein
MEGAQRPVGRDNETKKTSARSARMRTRGQQNPLVFIIYLSIGYFVYVCVTIAERLGYSISFNNQTDQGDEMEVWRGRH